MSHCSICQKVKVPRGKEHDLLMPLSYSHILDFVINLPPSSNAQNTQCLMIGDRFSKFCMLILCKANVTSEDVARFFVKHCYPICGLPKSIVSDRDAKFTSHFWRVLFDNFSIKLNFSSAFHP